MQLLGYRFLFDFLNHVFLPFISSRILAGLRPICPSEESAEAYKALQMNMSSKVSKRLSRPITWQWRPFFITFVNCIDFRHDNKFIKSSEILRLCQLTPKDGKRKGNKNGKTKKAKTSLHNMMWSKCIRQQGCADGKAFKTGEHNSGELIPLALTGESLRLNATLPTSTGECGHTGSFAPWIIITANKVIVLLTVISYSDKDKTPEKGVLRGHLWIFFRNGQEKCINTVRKRYSSNKIMTKAVPPLAFRFAPNERGQCRAHNHIPSQKKA